MRHLEGSKGLEVKHLSHGSLGITPFCGIRAMPVTMDCEHVCMHEHRCRPCSANVSALALRVVMSRHHSFSLACLQPASSRKLAVISGVFLRNCSDEKLSYNLRTGSNCSFITRQETQKAKSKKCHVIDDLDTVDLINEEAAARLTEVHL